MKHSVMVVEDDQPILDMMDVLLRRLGYEPRLSSNGLLALDEVRRNPPSLILLDVMMVPINGWEFLERLRADPETRNLPVVLFTAHPAVVEKVAALHDDHLGVLEKPVSLADLKRELGKFIGTGPVQDR